jgi:uncharacterized lipoprotein YehR (DUF1307 family)
MDYLYKDARVKESKSKTDLQFAIKGAKEDTKNKARDLMFELKRLSEEIKGSKVEFSDDEFDSMMIEIDNVIQKQL